MDAGAPDAECIVMWTEGPSCLLASKVEDELAEANTVKLTTQAKTKP